MEINIRNIEKIIFHNLNFCQCIPNMVDIREEWLVSKRNPKSSLSKRSFAFRLMELLDENSILCIESQIGEKITLLRMSDKLSDSIVCPIDSIPESICRNDWCSDLCVYREDDIINITFWR